MVLPLRGTPRAGRAAPPAGRRPVRHQDAKPRRSWPTQLARIGGGGAAPDRSVRVAAYLDGYLAGKVNLKARTLATDREAFELYWKPALGHMRLVDVRARHVAEVIGEMMRIGQVSGHRPEMLRRMLAARVGQAAPAAVPGPGRADVRPVPRRVRQGRPGDARGVAVRRGGTARRAEAEAPGVD